MSYTGHLISGVMISTNLLYMNMFPSFYTPTLNALNIFCIIYMRHQYDFNSLFISGAGDLCQGLHSFNIRDASSALLTAVVHAPYWICYEARAQGRPWACIQLASKNQFSMFFYLFIVITCAFTSFCLFSLPREPKPYKSNSCLVPEERRVLSLTAKFITLCIYDWDLKLHTHLLSARSNHMLPIYIKVSGMIIGQ